MSENYGKYFGGVFANLIEQLVAEDEGRPQLMENKEEHFKTLNTKTMALQAQQKTFQQEHGKASKSLAKQIEQNIEVLQRLRKQIANDKGHTLTPTSNNDLHHLVHKSNIKHGVTKLQGPKGKLPESER